MPSRHCRIARVCCLKITAMHEMSIPPPLPPGCTHAPRVCFAVTRVLLYLLRAGLSRGFLRRGGVLVHVASKATLTDCDVSGSRLAGVDVRTGAEAVLEACSIRGGKASGL